MGTTVEALTARICEPGGGFYVPRWGRVVRVPESHCAVVCEGCDFFVQIPTRMGRDQAEGVRREHLLRVHHDELLAGRMALSVEPFEPRESRQRRKPTIV